MRILLDVSTSLAWTRPPVGIVRTEQKFAAFLLGQEAADVVFCRFDRARGRHLAVPREAVARRLERDAARGLHAELACVPVDLDPARPASRPRLLKSVRSAVGLRVQRSIARLPGGMRPEAQLLADSGDRFMRSVYWLGRRTWQEATRRWRQGTMGSPMSDGAPAGGYRELNPAADDVYVSLGLDWEYNDLVALERLKRERHFRTLLQCYDLIPVRFPHFMTFDARKFYSRYFLRLAGVADHVVAISRATRDDYRRFLLEAGASVPPLSVIHLGTDVALGERGRGAPPRPDLTQRPFVLCVGTIEPRKNHELLYHVWDRLVAKQGERAPLLVLVGMLGWGVQDLFARLRVNRRVADSVVILDQVADETLLWLYEHCLFTVFPSFCEGLGLPVVESLALGKPCVASNAPAVVEAAQGLVPTLDPLDFPAWFTLIERWVFDREALRAATVPLRGYRPQSWQAHGETMIALIREVAAARGTCGARLEV